jgi:HPt (histidine-containing phosphotransfer) domain-containing protein
MATLVDPEFLARLRALNDKFAASLPGTLEKLEAARAQVALAQPDPARLKDLHQVLHTIAGSAGTFGYAVLGQQARRLEQRMRMLMSETASQADWEVWMADLQRYQRWADVNPKADFYDEPAP